MKTATAVTPLGLGDFFGTWAKYFVRFMIGWGAEILRAALYMILGISFLAVGLGLPPEITAQIGSRHGGMTLFILIVSVALFVRVMTFVADLIREWLAGRKQQQPSPAPQQAAS